ncbi:MAG: hypothetical protein WCX32_00965 [Clostridia bacterium]|jgi:hypothetical protein
MAQSFDYRNAPDWIKDGRMTKRLFGDFAMLKNTNLYMQRYSEASTMLNSIFFIYNPEILKINNQISVASNAGKTIKKLSKNLDMLNDDYVFLQKLYSYYKDIIFAGFDFNEEFLCFLDLIGGAVKKGITLDNMKLYPYILTLSEYITSAHSVIFYATEIEIAHIIVKQEIINSSFSNFDIAHHLDKEDCSYYWKMRKIKNMWGSIANALDRALDFGKPLNVINIKENYEVLPSAEELLILQKPFYNRSYYKWLVDKIINMRTEIREKENLYYKNNKEKAILENNELKI